MPRLIAGFTGTRDGMTKQQINSLDGFLKGLWPRAITHGGCVGSDAEFHEMAHAIIQDVRSSVWPSTIASMRAELKPEPTVTYPPKPPLDRNKDIVDRSDILIATPKEDHEITRSGTWATIRYAESCKKRVFIFAPDGELMIRNLRAESRPSIDDERGYPGVESLGIPGEPTTFPECPKPFKHH